MEERVMDNVRTTIKDSVDDFIRICQRRAPHVCRVNGPCNGWPKDTENEGLNLPNKERWADGWVEHDEVYGPSQLTGPFVGLKPEKEMVDTSAILVR
jgi:hypothetical protein